ncbi:MAG: LysM peptidoglycan-binding domain-containing protein [Candidatus Latescibacteria bacterium]|nr:LysM peptidoglycan-binding domain-containing protein [Candidatus Latescibacterota bacterium]
MQKKAGMINETYIVKKGDTLWNIAKNRYGDPLKWTIICDNNPDIKNPHMIYPGQTIIMEFKVEKIEEPVIPPPPKTPETITIEKAPQIPEVIEKKEAIVRVLFTNNSNGKLKDCNCPNDPYGGLSERVSLIRSYRERERDFLLLDSGGYMGLSRVEKNGPIVLKLMEMMDYDAWGIGDQELYHSLGQFLNLFGYRFDKIINASLFSKAGEPVFNSHRFFTVNEVRFGVLGLVSKETFKFFPEDKMDFTYEDPDSTLTRLLPGLIRSSNFVIVLSQMGRERDEEIAKKWPGIDLIIGGHSQTLLEKEIRIGDCHIVQAGKNAGRVGEIILAFDPSRKLENFSYNLIKVSDQYTIPPDIKPLIEKK